MVSCSLRWTSGQSGNDEILVSQPPCPFGSAQRVRNTNGSFEWYFLVFYVLHASGESSCTVSVVSSPWQITDKSEPPCLVSTSSARNLRILPSWEYFGGWGDPEHILNYNDGNNTEHTKCFIMEGRTTCTEKQTPSQMSVCETAWGAYAHQRKVCFGVPFLFRVIYFMTIEPDTGNAHKTCPTT